MHIRSENVRLWAILVPRYRSNGDEIDVSFHREWDRRVSKMIGGLTILPSVTGCWGDTKERSIVVQLACSGEDMKAIAEMTAEWYSQEAVLYWLVSDVAVIARVEK